MTTAPERLATLLADRYRIERPLGAGGMGVWCCALRGRPSGPPSSRGCRARRPSPSGDQHDTYANDIRPNWPNVKSLPAGPSRPGDGKQMVKNEIFDYFGLVGVHSPPTPRDGLHRLDATLQNFGELLKR